MHGQSQDVHNQQQAEQFSTTGLLINAQHPLLANQQRPDNPVGSPLLAIQANNAGNTSSSPEDLQEE